MSVEAIRATMRASARELEPYDPAFCEVQTNLSANENAFGVPANVQAILQKALAQVDISRYPRVLADELRAKLAQLYGVDDAQVLVGNGGDELIFNLLVAFGGRGHRLVCAPPDFSVYELYAQLLETEVVSVERRPEDFSPRYDELIEAARNAELVFLTSPNNPTGDLFSLEALEKILAACPGVVLFDEAYMEFAEGSPSALSLLERYDNLVILRTFSKAWALAGARVGYVLGNVAIINALKAVRQPYSVNAFSQAAALSLLEAAPARELQQSIETLCSERQRLSLELSQLAELTVFSSQANFIFVRLAHAHEVYEQLRDAYSILVRDFSQGSLTRDCLRITVGTPAQNTSLVQAIRSILKEMS